MPGLVVAAGRRRRAPALVLLACAIFTLGACGGTPPRQVLPEITFLHLPPYQLDVARIELVETYVSPLTPPHVEHDMPVAPATVLRRWVADRLVAAGDTKVARVTIEDARVTFTQFAVNEDLRESFTTEQSGEYAGRVALRIDIADPATGASANASANATRTRTVPEGLTLNQRDQMLFEFAEALGRDLDQALSPSIEQYLAPYLK